MENKEQGRITVINLGTESSPWEPKLVATNGGFAAGYPNRGRHLGWLHDVLDRVFPIRTGNPCVILGLPGAYVLSLEAFLPIKQDIFEKLDGYAKEYFNGKYMEELIDQRPTMLIYKGNDGRWSNEIYTKFHLCFLADTDVKTLKAWDDLFTEFLRYLTK